MNLCRNFKVFNEFLSPFNEFLIHSEIYTWEIRLPKKTYHLKPRILIHWETYSLSQYIVDSIPNLNT